MTTEERNVAILTELIEAVDAGRFTDVRRYYAHDYVDHTPSPARAQGPGAEGIEKAFDTFYEAFPDTTHRIEHAIAEGDYVAARISAVGTHTGDLRGFAPTGKRVALETIAIYRFTDGKITERWCPQPPGVLEQLGLGDDHLA